ncbi:MULTISPECIES: thylakoid membrane photosystem I accumulation factor [Spirulina sp. CCY15215]|uniref:thylakoid membrane photosystem I accumulation factor n=1 Tax=Spirulina sp. CCY15215 TaxID=2767591 RepID=UPI00194FB784|nr:thylakoid membrane photosystem I accumulation factor [Spirulina major]
MIHSHLDEFRVMRGQIWLHRCLLGLAIALTCFFLVLSPAQADVESDRYDGNIFVLYAGDGSLVPASSTFKAALSLPKPVILAFYIDDSRDCKRFASVISHLKDFYGRVVVFVPINADSIPVKDSYQPDEPGYYYEGAVPQILIFDAEDQVRFNGKGQVKYEELDDILRELFNLEPRTSSVELQRRSYNEFSGEMAE